MSRMTMIGHDTMSSPTMTLLRSPSGSPSRSPSFRSPSHSFAMTVEDVDGSGSPSSPNATPTRVSTAMSMRRSSSRLAGGDSSSPMPLLSRSPSPSQAGSLSSSNSNIRNSASGSRSSITKLGSRPATIAGMSGQSNSSLSPGSSRVSFAQSAQPTTAPASSSPGQASSSSSSSMISSPSLMSSSSSSMYNGNGDGGGGTPSSTSGYLRPAASYNRSQSPRTVIGGGSSLLHPDQSMYGVSHLSPQLPGARVSSPSPRLSVTALHAASGGNVGGGEPSNHERNISSAWSSISFSDIGMTDDDWNPLFEGDFQYAFSCLLPYVKRYLGRVREEIIKDLSTEFEKQVRLQIEGDVHQFPRSESPANAVRVSPTGVNADGETTLQISAADSLAIAGVSSSENASSDSGKEKSDSDSENEFDDDDLSIGTRKSIWRPQGSSNGPSSRAEPSRMRRQLRRTLVEFAKGIHESLYGVLERITAQVRNDRTSLIGTALLECDKLREQLRNLKLVKDREILSLQFKLSKKEKQINYIRNTLYKEVVALREQVYLLRNGTSNGPYRPEQMSIFDWVSLLDEDSSISFQRKKEISEIVKDEYVREIQELRQFYDRQVSDLHRDLESITKLYESLVQETQREANEEAAEAAAAAAAASSANGDDAKESASGGMNGREGRPSSIGKENAPPESSGLERRPSSQFLLDAVKSNQNHRVEVQRIKKQHQEHLQKVTQSFHSLSMTISSLPKQMDSLVKRMRYHEKIRAGQVASLDDFVSDVAKANGIISESTLSKSQRRSSTVGPIAGVSEYASSGSSDAASPANPGIPGITGSSALALEGAAAGSTGSVSNSSGTESGSGGAVDPARPRPPTGCVAMVFTDVENSTRQWDEYPDDMEKALDIHFSIMRRCLQKHNGYEVKTEGDGVFATFQDAFDAAMFCLEFQEDMLFADWPKSVIEHNRGENYLATNGQLLFHGLRVRMGFHFGTPTLFRDDINTGRMDYFGPAVNRAARVGGAAYGGQILISEFAMEAIRSRLLALENPPVILDKGIHEFKGLKEPEHVFEILSRMLSERSFGPVRVSKPPIPQSLAEALEQHKELFDVNAAQVFETLRSVESNLTEANINAREESRAQLFSSSSQSSIEPVPPETPDTSKPGDRSDTPSTPVPPPPDLGELMKRMNSQSLQDVEDSFNQRIVQLRGLISILVDRFEARVHNSESVTEKSVNKARMDVDAVVSNILRFPKFYYFVVKDPNAEFNVADRAISRSRSSTFSLIPARVASRDRLMKDDESVTSEVENTQRGDNFSRSDTPGLDIDGFPSGMFDNQKYSRPNSAWEQDGRTSSQSSLQGLRHVGSKQSLVSTMFQRTEEQKSVTFRNKTNIDLSVQGTHSGGNAANILKSFLKSKSTKMNNSQSSMSIGPSPPGSAGSMSSLLATSFLHHNTDSEWSNGASNNDDLFLQLRSGKSGPQRSPGTSSDLFPGQSESTEDLDDGFDGRSGLRMRNPSESLLNVPQSEAGKRSLSPRNRSSTVVGRTDALDTESTILGQAQGILRSRSRGSSFRSGSLWSSEHRSGGKAMKMKTFLQQGLSQLNERKRLGQLPDA